MPWLSYLEDEVSRFHPEFESSANEALKIAGLENTYEWIHHNRTPGNPIIPDFLLRHKSSRQWILSFELKRKKEAVYSTRNQIQAKGYAEANQSLYPSNAPKYFAISNLEVTILFALNGQLPPRECQLQDGIYISGDFDFDSRSKHRQTFVAHIVSLLRTIVTSGKPTFETVWPSVLSEFVSHSENVGGVSSIGLREPSTPNWSLVRDYFANPSPIDSARVFLLRCLMTEYLRGILLKHSHPGAQNIPPLQGNQTPGCVANSIDALRQIDFQVLFDDLSSDLYRNLADVSVRGQLRSYVELITTPGRKIVDLAISRIDSPDLIDSLMTTLYPVELQDESGKVTTDPELAALLASLAVSVTSKGILDPCCGDGILLSATYDRLVSLGADNQTALSALKGIEADAIATRLACVRIALKQPASLAPHPMINILHGDLFANSVSIKTADTILMNPPFKRYEAQDQRSVPQALRMYYAQAIRDIDNSPATTIQGQPNLYNYYIEFIAKAATVGTRLGIILDNKWYHSNYGRPLRALLLKYFEIEAVVEYPHSVFFSNWAISTSILIARKVNAVKSDHAVRFVRCKVDPRGADLNKVANAFYSEPYLRVSPTPA